MSESHFAASTGYGYGDRGREALDQVYAFALGAEDALVRHNFVCGTHALTVALFGVLRPGDTMLSVTGVPYDTLQGVSALQATETVLCVSSVSATSRWSLHRTASRTTMRLPDVSSLD